MYRQAGRPIDVDLRRELSWAKLGDSYTHQIHSYPAKLLPIIAEFFVKTREKRDDVADSVLDPFCGSGTVALEASLDGAIPLICDANPFAALIATVKTTPYDVVILNNTLKLILSKRKRRKEVESTHIINWELWYSPRIKTELDRLVERIGDVEDNSVRDFFRVCLASVARKLSNADPLISVPVTQKESERHSDRVNKLIRARHSWLLHVDAAAEFERICHENIRRVDITNKAAPHRRPALLVGRDAKDLTGARTDGKLPLIITSPPYGSAQKYIRSSSLALNWLGLASPNELAGLEALSIGREHVARSKNQVCGRPIGATFENLISEVRKTNPRRARITELYLEEMHKSLSEISDSLVDGGRAVIVVGNNQVCGITLRNDDFVKDVMTSSGLELELSLTDSIKSRGLMIKRNKTASVIASESILMFKKIA